MQPIMVDPQQIYVTGIPQAVERESAVEFIREVRSLVQRLIRNNTLNNLHLEVLWRDSNTKAINEKLNEAGGESAADVRSNQRSVSSDIHSRSHMFTAVEPLFTPDRLTIPEATRSHLEDALALLRLESVVFDQWGLRQIEPYPKSALNFYGPPGTGKTLAAHCISKQMGRKILMASYAELESKFPGDGQKNLRALFKAASRDNAVLMIDEAETLLSRRIGNVTQGAEHSMNAMRSELILALEEFQGIVIFATNLFSSYDPAFVSRLRNVEFKLPDETARRAIWASHLPASLPIQEISIKKLAEINGISGRDIKNAVISAAIKAARLGTNQISQEDLEAAVEEIINQRDKNLQNHELKSKRLSQEDKKEIAAAIRMKEEAMENG